MIHITPSPPLFTRRWQWGVVLALFILGLGIRLSDLTDPPLDFHPTRQLRSAIIARGMYYRDLPSAPAWQRERAAEQLAGHALIEPPLFEKIVALTYRLIGKEVIWVARIYASLFWLMGGLALYLLARDMASPDGAILALAFYLFLPFGIFSSRSFQPDPPMVMMILWALWAIYHWDRAPGWKAAVLAGLLAGLALFVKAVALFPVLAAFGALVLCSKGFKVAVRDRQVWLIGGLAILPMIAYHFYGVYGLGTLESQFEGRFFPQMWLDPAFYVRWFGSMTNLLGFGTILAALLGVLLFATARQRAFTLGLWAGYVIFGLTFPYHIITHTYYQLPLVPIVALSLASLGALAFGRLATLAPPILPRLVVFAVLSLGVFAKVWDVHLDLAQEDYRHEPAYWQELADTLGREAIVVGLTHDYGNRLAYYGWITPKVWLPIHHNEYRELRGGSPLDVQKWFAEKTGDADYFLVTLLNQLNKEPDLKEILYQNYAIYAEGEGYIIFDLRQASAK
jgi:hypothetical protein